MYTTYQSTLDIGPATECGGLSVVEGTTFYGWCSFVNVYGNAWIYGRLAGGEDKGWFYQANLYWESGNSNVPAC